MRTRAAEAFAKQSQPRTAKNLGDFVRAPGKFPCQIVDADRDVQQVLARELLLRIDRRIAVGFDTESALDDRRVFTQKRIELVGAPQVKRALGFVWRRLVGVFRRDAVGIFRRIEPALRAGHLAHHVAQRVLGNLDIERITRCLRRLDVRQYELRLVVEHFLEVRNTPGGVNRISMEAAAHVVAHAAERHGPERGQHDLQRVALSRSHVLAQQQQQLARPRKFWRVAKAGVTLIERRSKLRDDARQHVGGRHGRRDRRVDRSLQLVGHGRRRLLDLVAFGAPHSSNLLKNLDESRPAPSRAGREIRAAEKRLERRRQPDAHRPAARSRRPLHERHVDAVDVGPLLAINLDRDKVFVEHRRDGLLFERFVLHHMTPMARGVADREKDRFVVGASPGKRFIAPGIPVDRIVGVLQQIRTALVRETIHTRIMTLGSRHFRSPISGPSRARVEGCGRIRA